MVSTLDVEHNALGRDSKGIYFTFHVLGDDPGLASVEENCDARGVEQPHFGGNGQGRAPPQLLQLPKSRPSKCLAFFRSAALVATIDPRYLISVTCLIRLSYTWSVGWGLQFDVMYICLGSTDNYY